MSVKKAYKLIKHGDPLLKQLCQPVTLPLSDKLDSTIDECINTLVSLSTFTIFKLSATSGGFLEGEVNFSSSPLSR